MKPKVSVITLGVENLALSKQFYQALGFKLAVEENTDNVCFFSLSTPGILLGLYPAEKLAEDAQVSFRKPEFTAVTLAHNVESPEMVDKTLSEAKAIGADIVKPGQKVFWGGYSGYFKDPSGFLWEVAFNPFSDLT